MAMLLFWGFGIAVPSMTYADPPRHAKAYGYKKNKAYKYTYYPASQVYYSPVRGGYYYPYAGGWRFGVTLPTGIILGNGVAVTLGGPTPYVYHPTVIQQYPVVIVP
ncbi:MAG TPA: hypothetical protein VJR29_06770 [bacterium]|nr:hypothetical protein [bacterium]